MRLQRLTRLAVLVATAVTLYRFSTALPLFPPFLRYDASEVPVLVGALAYGPAAGLLLELIKNLLHALMKGGANPIGLAANFVSGALLVAGTTLVYSIGARGRRRWLAIAAGAGLMALGMLPLNLYFFLPARGMAASEGLATALALLTPFNLAKGGISAALGILFYERLFPVLSQPGSTSARRAPGSGWPGAGPPAGPSAG